MVFSVYANQNFEYYPQIDLILEYSGTGYENVHLSFNTNQNKIFSIVDSLGEYYSYLVQTLDYNIIVTYPRLSQIQDGKVQKYIKCFIIGNDNRPLKFTGTNFDELNFRLRLNDLITGIYCDSSYIEDVSLKINFDINQNLEL